MARTLSFLLSLAVFVAASVPAQPPAEAAPPLDPLEVLGYAVTGGAAPGYVADRACQTCHAELFRSYQEVGMARSFYRPSPEVAVEDFGAEPYHHEASRRHYRMELVDGRYVFRRWQVDADGQPIHEIEQQVDWVLGSGNRSRTYLFANAAGELYQLPLAWYSQSRSWGMAPGFDRADHAGLQRRVRRECMFCHNAYPDVAAGSDLRGQPDVFPSELPEGIGCQRCHGPGAQHVREALRGSGDREAIRAAITNPARLGPRERLDICYGCHMQPTVAFGRVRRFGRGDYSFRPGEPLGDYMVLLDVEEEGVERGDRFEINHHPYRLEQSRCFQESGGRLDCLTCHDPHRKRQEAERAAFYREKCLGCHELDPRHDSEGRLGCVSCHMPQRRPQDVVQVTVTDHRIQIVPDGADLLASRQEVDPVIVEATLMREPPADGFAEIYRTLPILRAVGGAHREALLYLDDLLQRTEVAAVEPYLDLMRGRLSLERYDATLAAGAEVMARSPAQPLALEWSALALARSGRSAEAVSLLRSAVESNPQRTEAWLNYGLVLRNLGRNDEALAVLEKAVELRPHLAVAWAHLGDLHHLAQRNEAAVAAYRRALAIEPTYARPYVELASLLVARGEADQALRLLRYGAVHARPADPVAAALERLERACPGCGRP